MIYVDSGTDESVAWVREGIVRVRELAEWLGATFEGDGERDLASAAPLETAGASQLSFVGNRKAAAQAEASAAGCLIVPLDHANTAGRTVIRAAQPRAAFARAVSRLHPAASPPSGIHPTASVAADVECGPEVAIGPMAVVGEGTRIGKARSSEPAVRSAGVSRSERRACFTPTSPSMTTWTSARGSSCTPAA